MLVSKRFFESHSFSNYTITDSVFLSGGRIKQTILSLTMGWKLRKDGQVVIA